MEGISSQSGISQSDALSSLGGADGKEIFDGFAAQGNAIKMDRIRSFMGILSGCVAGILGFTGMLGIGTHAAWFHFFFVY